MVLDKANVSYIYGKGYSRVPVYDRKEVKYNEHEEEYHEDITGMVGVLMSRQLMLIDWDDNRLVESLPLQFPECVSPRINLVDLLQILRSHGFLMAFVCARPDLANRALDNEQPLPPEAGFMGIVTLEDILESILGDRIYDEGDIRDRDRAVATLRRWAAVTLQKLWRRRQLRRRSSRSLSPMRRKFDNHSNHGTDSNSFGTSSSRHNNNHRESENTPLLYKSSSFTYR
jgi:metal transporter CNNM